MAVHNTFSLNWICKHRNREPCVTRVHSQNSDNVTQQYALKDVSLPFFLVSEFLARPHRTAWWLPKILLQKQRSGFKTQKLDCVLLHRSEGQWLPSEAQFSWVPGFSELRCYVITNHQMNSCQQHVQCNMQTILLSTYGQTDTLKRGWHQLLSCVQHFAVLYRSCRHTVLLPLCWATI